MPEVFFVSSPLPVTVPVMVYLILYNIRSVHNVGSIFRTADAIGATKLFLVGYTPTPLDRFGRIRKDLAKVALRSEQSVPWEYHERIEPLLQALKKKKIQLIAVEQAEGALDYKKVRPARATALILGNEVEGIPQNVLNLCDVVAEIRMQGEKESLNVSVSAGIALFRLFDRS